MGSYGHKLRRAQPTRCRRRGVDRRLYRCSAADLQFLEAHPGLHPTGSGSHACAGARKLAPPKAYESWPTHRCLQLRFVAREERQRRALAALALEHVHSETFGRGLDANKQNTRIFQAVRMQNIADAQDASTSHTCLLCLLEGEFAHRDVRMQPELSHFHVFRPYRPSPEELSCTHCGD